MTVADFKAPARVVDREASRRKLLRDSFCRAHARFGANVAASNCHHLLGKGGRRGDDDEDNLIPLCGSGSHGCHGALHGNPFVDRSGARRSGRDVRLAIGLSLRPSEYHYLLEKLGRAPAAEFLAARYHVRVVRLMPLLFAEVPE